MSDPLYVPTFVLSLILIVAHLVYSRAKRQRVSMLAVVNAVFFAGGIVAGLLLIASTLSEDRAARLADDFKIYVLIGGIATIYASVLGAWNQLFTPRPKETREE